LIYLSFSFNFPNQFEIGLPPSPLIVVEMRVNPAGQRRPQMASNSPGDLRVT
jgi:hypothetical protein